MIGDSIAYGQNDPSGGWSRILAAEFQSVDQPGRRWWNLAIPGDTLVNLESYAVDEVRVRQADTVLISASINDLTFGTSPERLMVAVRSLVRRLDFLGARSVVATPVWYDGAVRSREYNPIPDVAVAQFRELLLDWGVAEQRRVLDLWPVLQQRPDLLDDGLHPTAQGHVLLADAWRASLASRFFFRAVLLR